MSPIPMGRAPIDGDRDELVDEDVEEDASSSSGGTPSRSRRRILWMLRKPPEEPDDEDAGFQRSSADDPAASSYMGTCTGVFSPVSLSMFSSLLFLRVGYIVGNCGALGSILLLLFSYLILGLTVLSICAISTNGAVKGGGVYFMISRTLGPELGGSIGVLFWAANTVGCALFATGCIEAVISSVGPDGLLFDALLPKDDPWIELGLELGVLLLVALVGIVGPGLFGKFIFLFFVVVVVCALSIFMSFLAFFTPRTFQHSYNETTAANCTANCSYAVETGTFAGLVRPFVNPANFTPVISDGLGATFERDCHARPNPVSLFTVFGVLFSGVTGILAGANLSGELRNPSASIPRGTVFGTAFTFAVYLALFLLTAATCNRALLYHECLYMYHVDMWGPFIAIGTVCATVCASLSCLLGASRVMHAVGRDNMLGSRFRSLDRELRDGNPVVSVMVTAAFVAVLFFYGSLNAIAQLCSVLYLLSYAAINASCFFLDAFSAPNFRPTFLYFHSSFSLAGFALTVFAMFAINWGYAIVSVVGCLAFTVVLAYFSPAVKENDWGSIVQNLLLHQVRKYLLKLDPRKEHVKYWRPHILLLVSNPRRHCAAIRFVNAMKKGGLYVLGHVHVGDFDEAPRDPPFGRWLELIDRLRVKAFAECTVAPTVRTGVQHLARIAGVGALKPNTVVLGFRDPSRAPRGNDFARDDVLDRMFPPTNGGGGSDVEYVRTIADVLKIGKNVCVHRHFDRVQEDGDDDRPDVGGWWRWRSVRAASSGRYIDVWLLDFFSRPAWSVNGRRDLFMLQMAYVVSISRAWKKRGLRLRVLYRAMGGNPVGTKLLRHNLKKVLAEERIKADREEVAFDDVYRLVSDSGAEGDVVEQLNASRLDVAKIPTRFVVESNRVIRERSGRTAVAFLPLPAPPENPAAQARYLELLTLLTNGLPPTVMIHGIHAVTSTAL